MRLHRWTMLSLLLAFGLVAIHAGDSSAQDKRQYYGEWAPSGKGFHYCHYFFKPSAGDPDYKHHYAICYPTAPRYIYFYNPQEGAYWGRYDCHRKGYSMLPVAARKPRIAEITEKSFPAPAALPTIPQAKDNVPVAAPPELPPADLPPG